TIKVEVYDWDRDGSHDFIGEFTTSYRELSRGQSQFNVYEPAWRQSDSPTLRDAKGGQRNPNGPKSE
ncbi:UNVERIFIED_CONTAM: hypothetical protein K2H54_057621, partial [Gekko kuhli]